MRFLSHEVRCLFPCVVHRYPSDRNRAVIAVCTAPLIQCSLVTVMRQVDFSREEGWVQIKIKCDVDATSLRCTPLSVPALGASPDRLSVDT